MEAQNQNPQSQQPDHQNTNQQAPNTQFSVTPDPASFTDPKSNKKIIIIITVIILLVGAAAYWIMRKPANMIVNNQTENSESEESNNPATEIETLIQDIRTAIQPLTTGFEVKNDTVPINFTPEGQEYYVTLISEANKSLVVSAPYEPVQSETSADMQKVLDEMRQRFKNNGYSESEKPLIYDDSGKSYHFTNNSVLCSAEFTSAFITLGCATLVEISEFEKMTKPLIDAYIVSNPGLSSSELVFGGNVEIEDSPTPGYRRARMGIGVKGGGGTLGLFYEVSGKWAFFLGTQDSIMCSEFEKTPDVAKAFEGEQCYLNENQPNSTVEVPTT